MKRVRIAMLFLLVIAADAGVARAQVNVVDAKGKVVGAWDGGYALREIDGVWLDLAVSTAGFSEGGFTAACCASYTTSDCSGTMYFQANGGEAETPLAQFPYVQISGVAYFAKPPFQQTSIQSCGFYNDSSGAPVPVAGQCFAAPNPDCNLGMLAVAPLAGFQLSKLKLKPPFKLAK